MTSRVYTSIKACVIALCGSSCVMMTAYASASKAKPAEIIALPVASNGTLQQPIAKNTDKKVDAKKVDSKDTDAKIKPNTKPSITESNTLPGQSVSYGKEVVQGVSANGNVNLYSTKVKDETKVNGDFSAINANLQDMNIKGSADLFNTVISGTVTVYGSAQFGSVAMTGPSTTIYGNTILRDSAFTNLVNINGSLTINNCKIYSDLITTSRSTQITASDANNIYLTAVGTKDSKPVLYLNETTVKGNVKFEKDFGYCCP